jgi:hypothetical protein
MAGRVVTHTYWKAGNGDPYNGGRFGFDTEITEDGDVAATVTYRPAGAIDIAEAEYDALVAAFQAEWDARAVGGQEFVDESVAERDALRNSATAKLVAGTPLTAAEATAITGGS